MRKIRIGNDFWQSFQIKEKGVIADLLQVKDTVQVFAKVGDKCFEVPKEMVQIKEDGIITMEVKAELFNIVGRYEVIVKYWHHDISMSDQDRKQAVNFMPFVIVGKTEMADSSEDIPIVGDIIIGLKGEKGDSAFTVWNKENGGNNTYDDWIDFLQAPATQIEGIVSANEAIRIENENTRKLNEIERKQSEQTRQSNESARVTAEIDRESNEDTRSLNEAARLTNEDDRIENENQRVINEGKREQFYDNTVILKGEVETLKTETETAKDNAITATNQINTVVIPNAELATQNANDVKTDYDTVVKPAVQAQGDYAQAQGDYAKEQGEAIQDDLELKANQTDLAQLESDVSELELKDVVQSDKIKDIENVISTMNPNQSAQLSVSGVSPLSLPKNASNGGMGVKLEGLTAENLIVNGDFRNGTMGWGVLSGINITTSGGYLTVNHNLGASATTDIHRESAGINVGDKIYASYNTNHSADLRTRLYFFDTGSFSNGQVMVDINTKISKSSSIVISTKINPRIAVLMTPVNKATDVLSIGNISLINLTTTFGAGNEPTLEECDAIFSDYFEGVKSFVPTGRVRSVDKNGLNPTALYLTAPELRSNGTVKDEIRKGANGYELVKRVEVGTLGDELITNAADREFSSDTGFWNKNRNAVIANGVVAVNNATGSSAGINKSLFVLNKSYRIELEIKSITSGGIRVSIGSGNYKIFSTVGKHVFSGVCGGDTTLRIYGTAEGQSFELDNVSVKEIITANGDALSTSTFTELSDGTILYTLATPEIIPISYGGILNSAESGTVYHEPIIADAGVYDTKMDVLLTDYPIATIEEIIKHENGIDMYLDVSTAVIASDGLSFTHPDLTDGDLVLFTYAYDKESTNGNITATFYDSNVVKIDTATGKAYKIEDVVTDGVLTRTLTEV